MMTTVEAGESLLRDARETRRETLGNTETCFRETLTVSPDLRRETRRETLGNTIRGRSSFGPPLKGGPETSPDAGVAERRLDMSLGELHEIMRAVQRRASRYRGTPLGRDDAAAVGNLAIVEAAGKWDPGTGVPLAAFCLMHAKWAMATAAREFRGTRTDQNAEIPTDFWERPNLVVVSDCYSDLMDHLRSMPQRSREVVVLHAAGWSNREIAERYGVCESRICQLLAVGRRRLQTAASLVEVAS